MRISQTPKQIEALKSFQDHCEIESITLLSCDAVRAKCGTQFEEPFSVRPALTNISNSLQDREFIADVSFEYTAWDSSEPPTRLFAVNCTFEVCYRILDDYVPSEDERSSFSKGTAVFNCWPYAREFLREITERLGHQAPPLPLLRIVPKKSPVAEVTDQPKAVAPPPSPDEPF